MKVRGCVLNLPVILRALTKAVKSGPCAPVFALRPSTALVAARSAIRDLTAALTRRTNACLSGMFRANSERSMTDPIKIVLDTNVLVAAARSRSGASFALLNTLAEGRWQPCVSTALLLEYEER